MSFYKSMRSVIMKADIFYTSSLLRFGEESEYRSVTGGISSILMVVTLVVVFYSKISETLNKQIITSSTKDLYQRDPGSLLLNGPNAAPFMFAVEIWGHDLNTGPRLFDLLVRNIDYQSIVKTDLTVEILLEPCSPAHW